MGNGSANLQYVVDIQNKMSGLEEEIAGLEELQTRLDAVNASAQGLGGFLAPIPKSLTDSSASAQQVEADLKSLTGVAENAAAASISFAAGWLPAGVNISKARAEATTLFRELLTGMNTTRTFGSLLSALGPAIGIAAVAGFGLYEIFVKSSAEAKKITDELIKENSEIEKQVRHWSDLALVAKDFQDVVRLGEKIDPELDKASEKLDELQKKSLGFGQALEDVLIDAYKQFGPQIGLPDVNTNRDAIDAAIGEQKALNAELLRQGNLQLDIATDSSALWHDYKDGVITADEVTKSLEIQIANVQKDLAGLDRNKSFFDFQEWVRFDSLLVLLQQHLKQVKDDSDAEKEKAQRREVNDLLKQEQTLLQGIKDDQEIVSRNPFLSADAKNDQLHTLALREQAEVLKEIALVEAEIAKIKAIGDPQQQAQVEQLTQKLQSLRTQNQLLGFQIRETGTFTDQMTADLAKWVQSFGTSAHQISGLIEGSINAALQGTNQLLLDSIFRTGNWRQAFLGVEEQIASLFLKWIEQMALQKIAQIAGIQTTTQAQTASGTQIAAAHAPAAAATSISTYGAAAIIGEVLAIAAIGAIIAAVSGAFHEGGMVETRANRRGRSGPMSSDERLVLALEGEGIFTEDQMDYLYPTDPGKFKPDQLAALGGKPGGVRRQPFQPPGQSTWTSHDPAPKTGPIFVGPPVRVPPGLSGGGLPVGKLAPPAIGPVYHAGGLIVAHRGLVIDPDDENNPLNWFTPLGEEGWIEAGGFLGMFGGSAQANPGGITATGYPGMFPDASPTSDPSGAGLVPSSLGGGSLASIDYWNATSQYGTYGVDWFYDANGDPQPKSYFSGSGTTPSAPPGGGTGGTSLGVAGIPFGVSPGAFSNGTWVPSGSPIGTSFGSLGFNLTGVPGTFVTTPSGQTYSTAVGMFGLGAMNAPGGSFALGLGGPESGIELRTEGESPDLSDVKLMNAADKAGMSVDDYSAMIASLPGGPTAPESKAAANPYKYWSNRIKQSRAMMPHGPGQSHGVLGLSAYEASVFNSGAGSYQGWTFDPSAGVFVPPTGNLIGPTTGALLDDLGAASGYKNTGKKYHSGGAIDEMNITAQIGEFMQSKRAVDYYGVDAMHAINSLRVPIDRIKLHDGGPVGGPFAGGSRGAGGDSLFSVNVHSYTDLEALKQGIVNSDANKDFVINTVTGRAHEVGLSS